MTKIETRLYRAAALFVDGKELRPPLHYIRVENHPERGVILVATNGHTLIAPKEIASERGAIGGPAVA